MPYELRLDGLRISVPDEETGVHLASWVMHKNPDAEPELVDARTGRAAAPAASRRWREELTQKIGYG